MKKDEVPQEVSRTYGGMQKLMYAVDDDGSYVGVKSVGWDVETYATVAAVEAFERLRDEALEAARAGRGTPLEYHMNDRRMDLATLAGATGLAKWRIKRHLRPAIFERLPPRILERYAHAMGLDVATLSSLPEVESTDVAPAREDTRGNAGGNAREHAGEPGKDPDGRDRNATGGSAGNTFDT